MIIDIFKLNFVLMMNKFLIVDTSDSDSRLMSCLLT